MKCISLFLLCIIAAYTFSASATIEITAPMQLADYKMNAEIYKTINEQFHENNINQSIQNKELTVNNHRMIF